MAVPYAHLGIRAVPLVGAEPAVLTLVWPEGRAHHLVADLARIAGEMMAQEGVAPAQTEPFKTNLSTGLPVRESSPSHVDHTGGVPRRYGPDGVAGRADGAVAGVSNVVVW